MFHHPHESNEGVGRMVESYALEDTWQDMLA